jgi:sec-independent protein translocase protein TatB
MEVMFHNLGWSEIIVLAVIGLIIFGPDRLPKAAADAARMMRQLRTMARSAASDLKAELGPEMADLDLASLHPRRLASSLLDDDATDPLAVAAAAPLAPGERPPYDDDAT